MANNIITAAFSSSTITYTKPAYQYDYGMILKFSGIDLPQAYEVHFSNTEFCGESISQIGDETGVTIPDEMFLSGAPIYAWTYLHTSEDDGETVYKTVISINKRAQPSDIEPTPVQQDVITQAIAALNVAVEQTAQDVIDATAAKDAAETAHGLAESARDAAETAQGKAEDAQEAAENAQEAAETAQGKAEDAQEAAEQAAGAVLGLTADASVDANTGTPSVEVNVSTVSDHKNMSFSFHNLKGDPGDPGDDGFSPVVSVSSITGGHEVAVTDKNGTQTFDVMDGTDGQDGISPTITVTEISGGHEVEVVDAEGTQTFNVMDGEVSEQDLEDALIDKADVITSSSSGEIITISDGAKNLPVVDLSVSLLPVQDLHGQDAPYPAGGGKNKLNAISDNILRYNSSYANYTFSNGVVTITGNTLMGFKVPVEPSTQYTASYYKSDTTTQIAIRIREFSQEPTGWESTGYIGQPVNENNTQYNRINGTFTTTENTTWVIVAVYRSGAPTGGSMTISNWQLEKGATDTAYAPYSNICPISGWTGVDLFHTADNIFGGNLMRDGVLAAMENATDDPTNRIVSFVSNYTATQTITNACKFKENTQYTVVLTLSKGSGSGSNMRLYYTDGTYSGLGTYSTSKSTVVTVSTAGKTIDGIYKYNASGTTYLYYDESGIFEGVHTVDEFKPYVGQTYPISWQSTAGTVYGGNIDPVSGVLTVTDANIASYDGETLPSTWISDRDVYAPGTTPTTGAQVVYKLATPTTYQLTPSQIATFLGTNNFWSNSNGSIDLEYRCDTKLYIENLTKPSEDDMVANSNITSGSFFMVGNRLFLSSAAIGQGEAIVPGTNCSEVSLADALNSLNS